MRFCLFSLKLKIEENSEGFAAYTMLLSLSLFLKGTPLLPVRVVLGTAFYYLKLPALFYDNVGLSTLCMV
jgi:hypothetical protein